MARMNGSWLRLLGLIFVFAFGEVFGADPNPVRLFVKEVPLKVLGKEVSVIAIEQEDGTQGYSPEQSEGFHVEVVKSAHGAYVDSLAWSRSAESDGWRSLCNSEPNSTGGFVSLRFSPQAEWHLLDALALRSAGTTF